MGRKYSFDEIRRMRAAVEMLGGSSGAEDRLRTYMQNGTEPEELEREARVEMDPVMSHQRKLQRQAEGSTWVAQSLSGLTR